MEGCIAVPETLSAAVAQRLHAGLRDLGLPAAIATPLLAYLALLRKWNRAYNLSAVREPEEMVTRHLLDSLAVLPHVRGPRVLDVGTGPGLPGIPLAIARPELHLTLLDSNGKKTRFLRQAQLELKLSNVEVVEARVEAFRPEQPFQTVISRAFAAADTFFELTQPLAAPDGRLLAMKGRLDATEVGKIPRERGKLMIHALTVPGLAAERHLLELRLGT